jgi:acyl-CoA synthetase (AMP-forming)/AMP-acid ligase II
MDEDGFIWIIDHKKDVIITGGENIFPVEIEDILQSHQKVYDVAVIGIPDERLGEIATAIIDPKPRVKVMEKEVLDFCTQYLCHFK